MIKFLKPNKGKIVVFLATSYLWAFFISFQLVLQQRMSQSITSVIFWHPLLVHAYPFAGYYSIFPGIFYLIFQYLSFYIFSCFIIWAHNKLKYRTKLSFLILFIIILISVNINLIITKTFDFIYDSYAKSAEKIMRETMNTEDAIAKCKKITQPKDYTSCISEVALMSEDSLVCKENTNSDYFLRLCLAPLVMKTNDISLCELMPLKIMQNECYVALAVKNNDPEICNLVEVIQIDEFSRNETYTKSKCINFNIEKGIIPQEYGEYK